MVYVLEFKRTSDQRRDYRENGESRARVQHDVLIRSLEKVAGETEREGERWKVKLIVFVGGACGSVHVQTFNNNLKELGVVESTRCIAVAGLVTQATGELAMELAIAYYCVPIDVTQYGHVRPIGEPFGDDDQHVL